MILQSSFYMYNLKITISTLFHNWFWGLWMKNIMQDECELLQKKLQHNVNSYKIFIAVIGNLISNFAKATMLLSHVLSLPGTRANWTNLCRLRNCQVPDLEQDKF